MRTALIALMVAALAACGNSQSPVKPTPRSDVAAIEARADILEATGGATSLLSLAATDVLLAGSSTDASAAAAVDALERMNADVRAVIERVTPRSAGAFDAAWREHVSAFRAYAKALVEREEPARLKALEDVAAFSAKVSKAVPGLSTKLAAEYVERVRNTIDAAAAHDLARSAQGARTAQESLDKIASAVAGAAKLGGNPRTPRGTLVSSLTRVLAERSALIAAYGSAQRRAAGRSGAVTPLRELGAALDENAVAAATAFSSPYPSAESKLLALLRTENSVVIAFGPKSGTQLDQINAELATLLGSAVTHMSRADSARFSAERTSDVRKILAAFKAGKPGDGYSALYDALHHNAAFAKALTAAAAAEFPERFRT